MEYAVFDWDNTIRRGFTLFSWLDFLYEQNVIDKRMRKNMDKIKSKYALGAINHDDYARLACELYALEMKGVSRDRRNNLVKQYMQYDRCNILPFSEDVFQYMNQHGIKSVIISGAPQYIIEKYKDLFHLYDIYAFCEKYERDFCTGEVAFNYGMNKKSTIKHLCEVFGERPLVGFGDSYSDIPIFEMSKNAFCIVDKQCDAYPYGSDVTYVDNQTTGQQMRIVLQRILDLKRR